MTIVVQPKPETAGSSEPAIKLVDIGGLYSNDKAAKARVAAEIGAACDEIGFFYAVNHHVPLATIEAAHAKCAAFFAQPVEERQKAAADRNNRGYRQMGDIIHKSGQLYARDSFDLGFPMKADDPEVLAGTPLYAPNQWPALPGFEEAVSAYYQGCYEVGMKVLEGFALHLGKPTDFFSRHFTRPVADMVLNHYYPYSKALGFGATEVAAGAHTDHGIVTILWQDSLGGLEIMDRGSDWVPVPPVPGSFVINIGELMKRWTNGRFKSTIHRVVHTKEVDRFSMPLFCNPDFHTTVDPRELGVSEGEAKYTPVMSGDFLVGRFKATRKLWGAERKASDDVTVIERPPE